MWELNIFDVIEIYEILEKRKKTTRKLHQK